MRPVAGVVAAAVLLLLLGGCAAAGLPSSPSAEDAQLVAAHPSAGRCIVTASNNRPGRPALVRSLAATGLFEHVDAASETAIPAGSEWIVAERNVAYVDPFNTFCPDGAELATIATLGIVPTIRSRSGVWCLGVRRATERPSSERLFYVGEPVTSVAGWLALPMLLCPWWWRLPTDDWGTGREADLLAVAIVKSGVLDEPPPAR